MRLFLTMPPILLIGGIVAACSLTESDDSEADSDPSVRSITSTPTTDDADASESPSATPTSEEESATPAPTETPGDQATPTSTPTEADEATEPPADDVEEVEAEVKEIESAVIDIRGLESQNELSVEVIAREDLQSRIEEIIAEEYSPDQAELDTLTYWMLRLIDDRDLDLYQLQIDLLSEQVAGYYDPETDELVVVTRDGRLSAVDKVTTAHEIVHALQDQHFDLIAIDERATNSDEEAAITSLIEGDASVAMALYMFEALDPGDLAEVFAESLFQADSFEVMDNAPRYVSEGLLFPYQEGQSFVEQLFSQGDFTAINEALQDPPLSTEQILHPEKYTAEERDDPVEVTLPDLTPALGDGWSLVSGDALGEWDLRIMLDENGADEATEAAAGWGGSWFDVYQSGDDAAILLGTAWDTDADADEFESAVEATFEGMDESNGLMTDGERYFALERAGGRIYIISGTDADAVSTILGEIAA